MAKTEETIKLEKYLYDYVQRMGLFSCFEVTIGFNGNQRVDMMTYDTKGIWRCYEIKTSLSDFNSKAKQTFIGNYNYYVLTNELYEKVKDKIPSHIGVFTYNGFVKKPKKQDLQVDETILYQSMIRSLFRDADKHWKSDDPDYLNRLKRRIAWLESDKQDLQKRNSELHKELFYKKYKNAINEEEI